MKYNEENLICFYQPEGRYKCFSTYDLTSFSYGVTRSNGQTYSHVFKSVEQYLQFQKAVLFEDDETARNVMFSEIHCCSDNVNITEFGRHVTGFDEKIWKDISFELMIDGLYQKFIQNFDCRDVLISTGDATLVQASPNDTFWGVGLSESPLIYDSNNWKGENKMGEALMYVRKKLLVSSYIKY